MANPSEHSYPRHLWRPWGTWSLLAVAVGGIAFIRLIPYGRSHDNPASTGEPERS